MGSTEDNTGANTENRAEDGFEDSAAERRRVTEDYDQAGFNQTLGFGRRAALVVIDVCKAYTEEGSPLFADCQSAVDACGALVDAARANGVPVLWTRVRYQPGGADGGLFYRKVGALACFDEGNPLGDWVDGLEPADDEVVVTKQYASAFFGTSLASTLAADGVDSVLVCGVSTSGCVRASATDALQHGFRPLVVGDACGDRDAGVHEANLFDLNAKYADVISLDDALGLLGSRDA